MNKPDAEEAMLLLRRMMRIFADYDERFKKHRLEDVDTSEQFLELYENLNR